MAITFYEELHSPHDIFCLYNKAATRLRLLAVSYNNKNVSVSTETFNKIIIVPSSSRFFQNYEHIKSLKRSHIIGYDICDNYPVKKPEKCEELFQLADFITCTNVFLKKQIDEYLGYSKPVYVIEDPVWYNFSKPSFNPKEKIEILLYEAGDEQRKLYIEKTIKEISKRFNVNITLMSRIDFMELQFNYNFVKFSVEKQEALTKKADFVILPSDPKDPWLNSKSPNRVVDGLACGTMVIADKIDSYLPFTPYAEITDNFVKSMEHCLENRKLTLERIKNGQVFIKNNFSKKIIRDKWNKLSHTLTGTN